MAALGEVPPMFMTFLGLMLSTGHAMMVPGGWTPVGPHHVVLDPLDPSIGEVREFIIGGGTGDVDELCLSLMGAGYDVLERSIDEHGAVNLRLDTGLGRARFQRHDQDATWVVVLASVAASGTLDPDALIAATLPPPTHIMWGATAQALPGGQDGSPWSDEDGDEPDGWVAGADAEPWSQRSELSGDWQGTMLVLDVPTHLDFRFEATGFVTLTRNTRGEAVVHTGTWATRKEHMRLALPGGGPNLGYQLEAGSLRMEFEGRQLTLHRTIHTPKTQSP